MNKSKFVSVLMMTLLWGGEASAQTWSYNQQDLASCNSDRVCAECKAMLRAQPGAYSSQQACEQANRAVATSTGLKTCTCRRATYVVGMMGQGGIRYSEPYSSYPIPEDQACSSLNQMLQGGGSITCE